MKWFGRSWGAPACAFLEHAETPEGKPCYICARLIEADDQGFVEPKPGGRMPELYAHRLCLADAIVPPPESRRP